jgi:hypothetical protein
MADKILHKRSNTVGSIPTTSSLDLGEIAINTNDGKIFIHKSSSAGESIQSALITDSTNTGSLTLLGSLTLSGSLDINSGSSLDISANFIDFDFDLFALSGSLDVTGSVIVTQGITGSLFGTASWAQSASQARTSSFINPLNQNVLITGSTFITGSFNLNNNLNNSFVITGSRTTTGSGETFSSISPTITLRNTANDSISVMNFSPTITATANAQTAIGLNINTTYTTFGSSTNLTRAWPLMVNGVGIRGGEFGNVIIGNNYQAGYSALYSRINIGFNTGNSAGVLIGHEAGANVSSGGSNILIGYRSMFSAATNVQNTIAIGEQSARSITGNNNVVLGHGALWYQGNGSTNITNAANGVYIGTEVRGFDNSDSNSIVIGYQTSGQGANTVVIGNNNIIRTVLKGNIGVGFTPTSDVAQVSASIHITGSSTTSLLRIDSPTINNILFVTGSGRVGIGTGTPTSTLDVSGSINANSLAFSQPPANSFNGEIVKFGAGTLTTGQLYFLSSSGTWSLSDASTTGSSTGMLGIAIGSSPTTDGLLVRGYANSGSFTQSTGSILYMATSSGIFTETAPSSSGHVVRVIGYKTTISNTIYFMPDTTWVTLA